MAKKILLENAAAAGSVARRRINLAGVGVGDGFFGGAEAGVRADFLYHLSLVDAGQRDRLRELEGGIGRCAAAGDWAAAKEVSGRQCSNCVAATHLCHHPQLYERADRLYEEMTGCPYLFDVRGCAFKPEEFNYLEYLSRPAARRALRTGDLLIPDEDPEVARAMGADFMRPSVAALEFVLNRIPVRVTG